ncbi:MAG TPA: hypothetical protein PL193_10220 [Xanthobacteraceae bacterium]|nr:hypothetical protein [Xanthobacteraceae bacterium]
MHAMSETAAASHTMLAGAERPARQGARLYTLALAILFVSAFALYWTSSFSLERRFATIYFGADSWHFTELATGRFNDRIMRLHPVTVVLALGWMKLFSPLTAWFAPIAILKAMFAFAGALGVLAAAHAFAAFMPKRHALLWGAIYAASTGIWYFSSIEESKILSAALATIYIAFYAHLRSNSTPRGAIALTAILFVACLNEITAAFLVAIPAIDTLIRAKFQWRALRWITLHSLAAFAALFVLEAIKRFAVTVTPNPEGTSFFEIFLYYFTRNSYDFQSILGFLQRWFFFNIAAPEPELHYANSLTRYGGDFEPTLQHYFGSPVSALLLACFAVMIAAAFFLRNRGGADRALTAVMVGLGAYALARLLFFFLFLPGECLLYSPSVTLAHLLLIAIPFAASRLPYKEALTATAALCLLVTNGLFIFTAQTVSYVN